MRHAVFCSSFRRNFANIIDSLQLVIVALHEKTKRGKENTHVPYRNSMMTSVLRDSLGGNCKTTMIATISAEKEQTEESISTCRFAQRVALVKNDANVNEAMDPASVIRRLKAEIKLLKEEIAVLKDGVGGGDELGETDKEQLWQKVSFFTNYFSNKFTPFSRCPVLAG